VTGENPFNIYLVKLKSEGWPTANFWLY